MTPKTEQIKEQETVKVERVCVGKRYTSKGQLVVAWMTVKDAQETPAGGDHPLTEPFSYWSRCPVKPTPQPGSRWMFTETTDGRTFTNGDKAPQFLGMWPVESQRMEWAMLSRTATIQHDKAAQAKKLQGADDLVKLLSPITALYRKSNKAQQAAILAVVVSIITGGE